MPSGPCDTWEAIWDCNLTTEAIAATGIALQAATEVLYALSGRRFGLCSITLRPCRRDCFGDVWPFLNDWSEWNRGGPTPVLHRGQWFNITCGSCSTGCSCSIVSEAVLPGPVFDIAEVKVDGVILPTTGYRLDENRILVRLGGAEWPLCNDLNLDDTRPGTWSVTARIGEEVPILGKLAVGALAGEFAKAIACDSSCRLPMPVQSIARQGVNITFLDPNQVFADGRTGLYMPDLFISAYNPEGLRRRSKAYNLDTAEPRRVG